MYIAESGSFGKWYPHTFFKSTHSNCYLLAAIGTGNYFLDNYSYCWIGIRELMRNSELNYRLGKK